MGKEEPIKGWFENLIFASSMLKLHQYPMLNTIINLECILDLKAKLKYKYNKIYDKHKKMNLRKKKTWVDNDILAIVPKSLAKPTKNSYNCVLSHQSAPAP